MKKKYYVVSDISEPLNGWLHEFGNIFKTIKEARHLKKYLDKQYNKYYKQNIFKVYIEKVE